MSNVVLWQHVFQVVVCVLTPQAETCCHNTALLITMYFYGSLLQKCNFGQTQCKLSEDGPNGPKHVEENITYFNVNFNILYV